MSEEEKKDKKYEFLELKGKSNSQGEFEVYFIEKSTILN